MSGYFVSADQPRAQRASDVLRIVIGVVLAGWAWYHVDRVAPFEVAIVDLLRSFPSWFESLYVIGYGVAGIYVVGLVVVAAAGGASRRDVLRDMLLALGGAALITIVAGLMLGDGLANLLPEFSSLDPEPAFPVVRIAVVTAVITVAAPSLTRPMRTLGWVVIVMAVVSGAGLGFGFPSDIIGAVGMGLIASSAVLLALGSPRGYPDFDDVASGLARIGISVTDLRAVPERSWGVRSMVGTGPDGGSVDITAGGRDASDSQWFSRFWHTLWYRDTGRVYSSSRRSGVEHEALMMLLADRAGVHVESVLAVGVTGDDDLALLATSRTGDAVGPDELTEASLAGMWREVRTLHGSGMTHGRMRLSSFRSSGDRLVLTDLSSASVDALDAARPLDVASLLFESSIALDPETAVRIACDVMGDDAVSEALPYVQVPALSRGQRKDHPKPKQALADLRTAIEETTGVEPPPPVKLRRVRPQDLVMPALSLIAASALISLLSDIDFEAVWDVVQDADWAWIVVGFVIGQFVFFPEATGMYYAVGYPLPLRPLTVLQVSVKWIGLAVPSAAGRVAMNTVFLRKYGVAPSIALTQGAIDGISGFLVEAVILVVALLAYDEFDLDLDTPELNWALVLLVVGLLIIITVTAVLRIQRLRALVVPPIRDGGRLIWDVVRTPRRAIGLLASNLAARTVLGIVLWFVLHAIGAPLPLVSCIVVTVATNLLAGLVPIPGGIGVAEAVLTSFLVVFGLPSEVAFAAAVVYRIATFYIPAGEGFFAMRWLESNGYI